MNKQELINKWHEHRQIILTDDCIDIIAQNSTVCYINEFLKDIKQLDEPSEARECEIIHGKIKFPKDSFEAQYKKNIYGDICSHCRHYLEDMRKRHYGSGFCPSCGWKIKRGVE